jgi:hypothetical protein
VSGVSVVSDVSDVSGASGVACVTGVTRTARVLAAAACVIALGAACSDSNAPERVEATFVLREDFQPFEPVVDPPPVLPRWFNGDTLVFRRDGTGERRTTMAYGERDDPTPLLIHDVVPFTYELKGDAWTIRWPAPCLPPCDVVSPPTSATLRAGVLYLDVFGTEYPYEPIE